jgi:N-acetylmuramoyl-L-alanine amidase/lipopolysaccharide export system protein LptA
MEWLNYLLKVSACSALFFAFYLTVLRKLTFFKVNRFYLLFSLIISFIIPTLTFTVEREVLQMPIESSAVTQINTPNQQFVATGVQGQVFSAETEVKEFDWYALLPSAYAAIVGVLLLLALWKLFQLIRHAGRYQSKINGLKLVSKKNGFTNCSFFNYVFIDDRLSENDLQVLLLHEEVHAKQFHSADKILMIVAKAILWFNPIIYLYDKELEQAHEYEADETTSKEHGIGNYAQLLLRLAVAKNQMTLVHNFVKSPIKSRIKMLFNEKSRAIKKLVYLLAIPITLCLIWGFTVNVIEVLAQEVGVQDSEFVLVLDAGHGGKSSGIVANGKAEKDISLAMVLKVKQLAEENGIKVVLTRTGDQTISPQERAKAKGSFLLSLHVNTDVNTAKNGIEMYTSSNVPMNSLKMSKSYKFTYDLYQQLRTLTGIKVNSKPLQQNLILLRAANMPGVLIEMGYLTNKNDFSFITNEQHQNEMAKLILASIKNYKETLPAFESTTNKFAQSVAEFNVKYKTWLSSAKYAALKKAAKQFKAQALVGQVQSINYFKKGAAQVFDGFILNANGATYRVFLTKEQLKAIEFKTGDQVNLYADKAEVWFDSDYPVLKPNLIRVTKKIGGVLTISPKIITALKATVDPKGNTLYLEDVKFDMEGTILEAKKITYNRKLNVITASKATITKDGNRIVSDEIKVNLGAGFFTTKEIDGIFGLKTLKPLTNEKYGAIKYDAKDSVVISKDKQIISMYGNAKISKQNMTFKGSEIIYNQKLNTAKIKNATYIDSKNNIVTATAMFVNFNTLVVGTEGVLKANIN